MLGPRLSHPRLLSDPDVVNRHLLESDGRSPCAGLSSRTAPSPCSAPPLPRLMGWTSLEPWRGLARRLGVVAAAVGLEERFGSSRTTLAGRAVPRVAGIRVSRVAARLFAYISYRDASAGLRWLEDVGFEIVRRQDGEDEIVLHAEVRLGNAVVMVASNDAAYQKPPALGRSTGGGLYLLVDDVDQLHARAVHAGGRTLIPPEDTAWGTRRARVLDPEGTEWTFGTYEPGASW